MEFHTEANIAAKMIEIRIPKALFKYRGTGADISKPVGDPVELSTTGVPKVNNKDEKKDSNTTPFNYYVEGDYLVFFNYKEINAGTNAAWQVLYKDVQIMDAVDGSSWDLSARVEVTYTKETEDSEGNKTSEEVTVSQESSRLCGRIDTGVYLEYAVKSVHTEPDKLYAPGLYTQSQVELFIGDEKIGDIGGEDPAGNAKLPAKYAEHMADWKFVVWEVAIRGSATQPWSLELLESPVAYVRNPGVDNPDVSDAYVAIPGEVVGYLNHTVEGTEYNLNINQGAEFKKTVIDGEEIYKATVLSDYMWGSWGNRFYIVTAYPAKYEKDGETLEIKEGDRLENNLEVRLVPVDSPSEKTRREWISDSWEYEKYDWVYSGDIIKSTKISNPAATGDERKTKVYNSWLEAYEKAKGKQKDYGDIYFSSTGAINGYGYAHIAPTRTPEGLIIGNENDETVGSYIEGNWYQMVAADDLLYAYPNGSNPVWLTGKDYYFSNITITQTDRGYDVSEDRMLPGPEFAGGVSDKIHIDGVKGGLVIQAVYSTETGGENNWEDAAYVEWDPSGNMVYSGTLEKDGRRPWRVRVIHNTLEYSTKCQIEVNVCLRHDSPVMEEMLEERRTDEDFYLQLKNYSAATGASFTGNDSSKPSVIGISEGSRDYDQNYVGNDMISGLGLEEKTKATYKALYSQEEGEIVLPDRDYADATLHGLQKTAAASKTAYLTNDADHSRVLVNYRLTAYDGYFVNDQATADYLKRMDVPSPGKQYVMFYDLLPHGVTFDPSVGIIAGRITDLDSNEYYKFRPDKWNTSKVNVSVDTATDVIENWNGTGRMMVIFHLSYDGDPAVYTNGRWIEGWGLSFGAYYDWKDVKAVQNESNISAFMPDIAKYGEEIPALIGPANTVYADDGSVVRDQSRGDWAAYRDFYPNDSHNPINSLNTDGSKQNVLYASCGINEDNTESSYMGIKMSVRADADIYGIYGDSAYVQASKGYTYETTLTADAGGMKDIVIFDHLENAGAERGNEIDKDPNWGKFGNSWTGTLLGVDLSDLNGQKVKPEVWYNADRNAETTYWAKVDGTLVKRESELTPDEVLVADTSGRWDKGWYKAEDYIKKYIEAHKDDENFRELSAAQQRAQAVASVGSVAVDLRNSSEKDANGDPLEFQLHANEKVTFKLKMRAPEWSGELANKNAFNNPSYHATKIDGTLGGPLMRVGNSVRVGIGVQSDLEIWKTITNGDEVPSALVGKTFTFTLYREDEDGKELIIANREFVLKEWDADAKAWVKVEADVPHATLADGTFTLQAGQKAVFEKMPMAEAGSVKAREDADVYWFVDDSNVTETALADGTFTVTREMRNTYHPVLYLQKDWTGVPQNMTEEETKGLASTDFAFQLTLDGQPAAGVEYCYVNKAALNGGDVNIVSGTVKPDADGRLFTDADGRFTIRKGEIIALFIPEADTDYQLTELGASKGDVDTSADWIIDSSKAAASGTVPQGGAKALVKNCYRWRDLYLSKTVINKNTPDNTVSFTFKITDQNGNPVTGKSWQLLEADKTPVAGYENVKIDPEGRITAPCAGRIIRIEGLEAGSTYHVTEVELPSLYVPVKASQDVWMPTEAASQSVTFVNDYQMRSLSVTKTVVAAEVVDKAFEMIIAKKGADGSYTYGPFTYQVDGGAAQQTAADGRFSLKNGQTAEFKEIGMVGETFYVWEVADENYPQLYPITENPADLAVGSSSFKVGAPAEAVLGQSGSVKFINGTPGALMLSKEYMGAQGDTPEQTAENQGIADAIKERISRQRQAQLYEDEIKLCQWVEGNLDEIHAIGQRMNELAVQGTNGTITAGDRVSILKEIFQLKEESLRVLGEIGKVDHSWGGEIGAIQAGVQGICSDLNLDEIFSDKKVYDENAEWNTEAWWQKLIEQIQDLIGINSEARSVIGCYQEEMGSQIENLRIDWYQEAFDVTVHLTVNGMDWTPTQSDIITCIDQLKEQISDKIRLG